MAEDCCGGGGQVMLLACSGASNVGQLSNRAAVELTQEGVGRMFCLAGIGARLSGFVQSARDVATLVVMDGCPVACGRKALELNGVSGAICLVLTETGIEKNAQLEPVPEEVARVKAAVKALLGQKGLASGQTGGGCSCTCGSC